MRDWSKRLCSTVLAATLLVSNIQPMFAFAAETEDTGLCEHHVTHENCGYVAAVAGADCKHEHDDGCFTVKCAHVHGDCGYVAAVEGVDCDHQHDGACGYAEAVAEVPCTCQQEEHTEDCAYAPASPEVKCNHVHGECSFVEAKSEVPCGHDCTQDEACGEKVLSCTHSHDESCGYVAAVEGKSCEFVCNACAAEEANAAAVAEVKALMDALPELEAVQAMHMEDQKAAYEQTQAAYEAYGKLTADQQQELADPEEVFKPLFEYFNALIDADGEIGSGTPDGTPPTLVSLAISSVTTITAPGTIELVAEATDNVSGVDCVYVDFKGQTNSKWLNGILRSTYWENGTELTFADGKLHGKITVDEYIEADNFVLDSVSVVDVAENAIYYDRNYNEELELVNRFPLTDYMEAMQFSVVEIESADGTPPTLSSLSIASATTITAPGTIELVAEATDDVSGVDCVYVDFKGQSNSKWLNGALRSTYWENGSEVVYADGKLHGKITVDEFLETDVFVLNSVSVVDVAENAIYYNRNYNEELELPNRFPLTDYMEAMQFTVTGSAQADGTPPTVTSLTISTTLVTAPGTIELVAEATDDVSGVDCVYVDFKGQTNSKWLNGILRSTYWENGTELTYADGKLHGKITINQYLESDLFVLDSVSVVDIAENATYYNRNYNETLGLANRLPLTDYMSTLQFTVTNVGADITTSTDQTNFVEDVKNAADDAYIVADFSSNSTLPQGAFDGIAGTNKTLDLTSEGVTWRFEGSDITNTTKDIDLSVQITKAESNTSDAGQVIQDKLNDTPGYIMKFAENGTLPGKATIQVKVDYAMREHLGSSTGLNVYYYNNQTGKLELVAQNLTVINDTYVEFSITHCSYYVLTAAPQETVNNYIKLLEPSGNTRPALVGSTIGVTVVYSPWDAEKDLSYSVSDSSILALDEQSHYHDGFGFKCLKTGTTTVTITDRYTGKSVSQEVTVVAPKIVNNVPYEDTIDVPVGSHYELYSFTPSETGVYTVSRNMDMSQYGASIYVEGGNLYTGIGGTQRTLLLDAGSTYLFEVRFVQCNGTETDVFKIVKSADVENQPLMLLQDAVKVTMQPWHENTYSNIQMHYSGNGVVTGSSSNPDVAEFSSAMNGYLTILAKKAGTATITVTDGTYSDTITVTVKDVTYLQLDKPLAVNTVDTNLFAFIAPEDGRYAFTMEVKDGTLASRLEITIDGVYSYSFTETTSTIAVELEAGKTFSFISVGMHGEEVTITATKIEAAPTAMRLIPGIDGNRLAFCVGFTPTVSGDEIVKWETSNRNILGERNQNPNSATKAFDIYDNGEVTVTATSETGLKASCTLVVGTCGDNLKWFLHDGTLMIFGSGAMGSFTSSGPWSNWQSQITSIVVNEGVTNIGEHAFENCKNITSVSLPDSISSIGYCAFRYCEKLTSINLPTNLTTLSKGAFVGCKSLTEIAIPSKITEISEQLFTGCTSLSSVTIPNGVTKIWNMAFQDTALTKVVLPDSVTSLGGGAAFANCKNLTEVVFSKNITTIELSTFAGCSGLTSITIPSHITTIKDSAFRGCSGLKKITFEGNAPTFEDSFSDGNTAFADVTATAYYPVGNATWTESVMQNYGGNIIWKPYCPNGHTVLTDKAVEATCTATGLTEGKHCSACGEVLTAQTTVSAKGHNYVNGYCSRCGVAAPTSGGSTGGNGSTNNGSSTNTGTGNAGTTTRPTTQPSQNGAELSAKELGASADRNASTTVAVDGVRITFDAKAQKAIADQATKDDIYLNYEEIKEAKLNKDQKKAIKDHLSDHKGQKHVLTFSITLISGGKEIHDFKGGTATVKIPFAPNPGTKGDAYKVFFVDGNGELHPMETTYEKGYLVVKLTHFSEYVVFHMPEEVAEETTEATAAPEETVAEEEPAAIASEPVQISKTDSVGMILWIIIALCIVGIVVIGLILLRMRKNKN